MMSRQVKCTARVVKRRLRSIGVLCVAGLVIASCGSDGADAGAVGAADRPTTMASGMDMSADGHSADAEHAEEFGFGEPMSAAEGSRVIEIIAKDDFTFEPASVTVTSGETVTFRVHNDGLIPHDFTLGDEHLQEEHDAEMAAMAPDEMSMHEEPNAFSLEPGDAKEMTWQFTEEGEILFGCHTPGHYAAGMKGAITIEA